MTDGTPSPSTSPPTAPRVCTLLTDFGWSDYYVAAVQGVLATRAPAARTVDVAHDVSPGDVEGGAWLLAAAARWFPAGTVHLAVVDPGVGSERRILAIRAGGHVFVGPDNGLLLPAAEIAAEVAGEPMEAHTIDRTDLWLEAPGSTFHGRDRFAPTAAAVLVGEPLSALGPRVSDAVRLDLPQPSREGTSIRGRVAHVDRFGNLVTDIPAAWVVESGQIEVGGNRVQRRVTHYAEIPEGDAAWLVGSLGTVELSLNGRSLADAWGVERGASVSVTAM